MGDCHFLEGNLRAKERVEYAKILLDEVALGGDRLEMYQIGASDAPIWAEKVIEMTERIKKLGSNPLSLREHTESWCFSGFSERSSDRPSMGGERAKDRHLKE
ncbi:MAG TPA: hydrogenase iron-sulfur subunit, partial [Desulfobacterales bacterium]|nr:hydrogenase iron-sulfur subunit [Desulfobacterales bacterium]